MDQRRQFENAAREQPDWSQDQRMAIAKNSKQPKLPTLHQPNATTPTRLAELSSGNYLFAHKVTPPELPPGNSSFQRKSPRGRALAPLESTSAKSMTIGSSPSEAPTSMGASESTFKKQGAKSVDNHFGDEPSRSMKSSANFTADTATSERHAGRYVEEDRKLNEELDRLRKLVAQDAWNPSDSSEIDVAIDYSEARLHPFDVDMQKIAEMPLRTPSPQTTYYSNGNMQHTVVNNVIGNNFSDPFADEIAAVTRAALLCASTPEEPEEKGAVPLPPCLSPDVITSEQKRVDRNLSSVLVSYNRELEDFVGAGDANLNMFWAEVNECLSRPPTNHEHRSGSLDLTKEHAEHSDAPSHDPPQQLVTAPSETTHQDRIALADKELHDAIWVGDAARLESAIVQGREIGVSASELSIAEQVLRIEVNKKGVEAELDKALCSRDACRLSEAISNARRTGVLPSKIRAAQNVLHGLQVERSPQGISKFS